MTFPRMLLVLWLVCISSIGHAETTLFMVDLFKEAKTRHPLLAGQAQLLFAAKSEESRANRLFPDATSLEARYRSDRLNSDNGLREIEIGLQAPIWRLGERTLTQEAASIRSMQVKAQLEQTALELAEQVRQSAWQTLKLDVQHQVAKSRLQNVTALLKSVEQRYEAGDLAKVDLLQAKGLLSLAQTSAEMAQADLTETQLRFETLTGVSAERLKNLKEEALLTTEPSDPTNEHPKQKAQFLQVLLLEKQLALLDVSRHDRTEMGVSLISERGAYGINDEKSLMLSTRIALGERAGFEAQSYQLLAALQEAKAEHARIKTQLTAGIAAAERRLQAALRVRDSNKQRAEYLRNIYQLQQVAFELGETDLPALLVLEQQAFEAERLATEANLDVALNISHYKQSLGQLPQDTGVSP